MRWLLLTPYFASGAALGTTKETSDRYRPLLRTHCEKFARGRCISPDLRNTQELKGICAEKPLLERGVIILFAEAGWGLLDRILCVSAHWFVPGTFVTGNLQPETIHDFGGFPRPLYEVRYPARGDTELAKLITTLLSSSRAEQRSDWGLDHGAWSVLMHLRPKADIPVLQLSIDYRQPPATHLAIGKMLSVLREQGILIIGSGNITHNLRLALRPGGTDSPTWATSFDADVARALQQHDDTFLLRALTTDAGKIAHPTPDHYLPLLYVAGASSTADSATFPLVGFDFGCLSMRSVLFS